MGENIWLCDSRINLEDLNEEIGSRFPVEDFDTLGGFVFDLFGKIPAKYEKVSWGEWDFIVQDVEGHKVNSIKVIRKADGNVGEK
jgi:CBS domain containing-hemolysin-like protein